MFDVRRFTALDMFGTAGTARRRSIILAEFLVGCPLVFVVAGLVLRAGHPLLGGWFLGLAANYLPLAAYAVTLFPAGRLEAELAGVHDVRGQLMRAGVVQFLLFVPFLVAVVAAMQLARRRTS